MHKLVGWSLLIRVAIKHKAVEAHSAVKLLRTTGKSCCYVL